MNKQHHGHPFRVLFTYLKSSWILLTITFLITGVLVALGLSIPWVMRSVLDDYLGNASLDIETKTAGFYLYMLIYIGLVLLQIAMRYLHGVINTLIGMRLERNLRENAFAKLGRLPIDYFSNRSEGQIVHRIETDSGGLRGLFTVTYALAESILNIIFVYATLILIDWRLAIAVAIIIPFFGVWMRLFSSLLRRFNEKLRQNNSVIKGVINEIIYHVELLQLLTKEKYFLNRYERAVTESNRLQIQLGTSITMYGFELVLLFQRVVQALTLAYLATLFIGGNLTITAGLIYAISSYIDRIMGPLHGVFSNINSLEDSIVATERMSEFLDEAEDSSLTGHQHVEHLRYPIHLNNVSFGYTPQQKVLDSINLTIHEGETIGIVGSTGSGKSTLMNLIMRFYPVSQGSISIGEYPLDSIEPTSYRHHLGIVLQTPSLFKGTLKDNLVLGNSNYLDQDLIQSLEQVGLDYLVDRHPLGIHQPIEVGGENLSVGEKQLIAFARILLRTPDIVLLDEATANIDSETEQKIQKAVELIASQSTMLIIAHRISTISHADRILVMDKGRIVAQGTHEELVQHNPIYQLMYRAQLHQST